ncbi:primary-amine oxidase [Sphaerospermopsis aphanizomenoides BCCUSP55]|uniref:primary-amine oxidase n=1 Tax=Sphaerospermopsis aphanizomenoides TaxID=459663 RepID=UPI001903F4CA|nr:primary-amine oxidase [Sphaerospermopsis aphanizomenoides]MBK1990605.1 primary-amine oxidase [Sphaerospermopsis aphanizomenoides BCCUSP55]
MISSLHCLFRLAIAILVCVHFWLGFPQITSAHELIKPHPLNPLTEKEINTAVEVLQREKNLSEAAFFSMITLQEPDKQAVLNFKSGQIFPRQVFLQVYEQELNKTFTGTVDLNKNAITNWQEIPQVQPAILPLDYQLAEEVVKADLRWQNAMKKRGIKDFEQVQISLWAAGILTPEEQKTGNRICRALSYYRGKSGNYFAHPIEGVLVTVDLNKGKVDSFVDTGVVAISKENWDYEISSFKKLIPPPKPLKISQPAGTTFKIQGNEITWQGWNFRYLMHPREGLVLYLVNYHDGEKSRPILYRGSLSEMAVPYGDPDPNWSFRNAFDVGEYNIGLLANKLALGQEIPENGVLLDAVFANGEGEPYRVTGVIGIYERDNGVLWKHFNYHSQKNYVRRNRELVISMITTIENYDYTLNWIFHQDGTLEVKNELTGIDLPQGTNLNTQTENQAFGRLLAKNIFGVNHQHFFNYRLDLDVDGQKNSVMEMNVNSLPISDKNPLGNSITVADTHLTTEKNAVRDADIKHSREWMIVNADKKNSLGVPTAYMLTPGGNTIMYAVEGAKIREKARFATHHFWVTKYKDGEMYAAGDYPNQSKLGAGLPKYIADNESVDNEDIVVWYTMGITHIPRPEDWPVMPRHELSFKLMPRGFFSRNPAINLGE